MGTNYGTKNEQIVIQERIEKAMAEEFDKLLKENKQDKLLKLIIDDKIEDLSLEEIKKELEDDE